MPVVTATVSASNTSTQIGSNDPAGEVYAGLKTTPIGFYGGTPVAQTSGAAQAALSRGVGFGTVATMGSSQSPATLASQTSVETLMTVFSNTVGDAFQVVSTDYVMAQKPSVNAGIAMGNVRATSTQGVVGVTFSNPTSASIIFTSPEKYALTVIRGLPTLTVALTPAAVAAQSTMEQQFPVPGLRAGEVVSVSKPTAQAALNILGARVVSAGVLGITFGNSQLTTPVTPTAGETYTVFSLGGLDAVSNNMIVQANVGTLLTVATTTTAEQLVTVTGLQATDIVTGVSKPSAQSGIGIVGYRASTTAGLLGITFANITGAAVTPTSSENYGVQVFRQNPSAPAVNYSVPLTPIAIAPDTAAEQLFTVTGVVANSVVVVNKPSFTTGLGIGGARATSTANIIGITFVNQSAQTMTPPAETYLISNFQQVIPDGQNTWIQQASPQEQQSTILLNAIRNAMAGMNLIAGA